MLTVNIGPLALAVPHVLLLGSLLLATLTGWWVGRRSECNPERQLFRLLLVALLVALLLLGPLVGKLLENLGQEG